MPLVGEGLTNALYSSDSSSILVLSPRIDPPVRSELGSIVRTASFLYYSLTMWRPSFSIILLLPAPGAPHIPILIPLFLLSGVFFKSLPIILSASLLLSYRVDSISVTVLLRATLWPSQSYCTRYSISSADKWRLLEWGVWVLKHDFLSWQKVFLCFMIKRKASIN